MVLVSVTVRTSISNTFVQLRYNTSQDMQERLHEKEMQDRRRTIKISVAGFSLSAITDATGISCGTSLHIHLDLRMCEHVLVWLCGCVCWVLAASSRCNAQGIGVIWLKSAVMRDVRLSIHHVNVNSAVTEFLQPCSSRSMIKRL